MGYSDILSLVYELRDNINNTNESKVLTFEEKMFYFERAMEVFTNKLIEKFCEGESEE